MKKKILFPCLLILLLIGALSLTACAKVATVARNDVVYGVAHMTGRILGTVERHIPEETTDGGLTEYPVYGKVAVTDEAIKRAIFDENVAMLDYNGMDKDGNLYKDGVPTGNKLFRHTASEQNYGEAIADTAPAVIKRMTIQPYEYGNVLTGLYAPAGEIITVIVDDETAKRGIEVQIGQRGQRGYANNVSLSRPYSRMPFLGSTNVIKSAVTYAGNPLGGPIYLNLNGGQNGAPYEVTIIGAVETPHYIYGQTTDEEWERLRHTAGTVFEMETPRGIRMTMPAYIAREKTAAEMYAAAEFWDKAAQLGHLFGDAGLSNNSRPNGIPITMWCDLYVPAGAAVAFVGIDLCVMPVGWGANMLNAEQYILSGGWGNLHELNHHHQGWGAPAGGEVTNNAINALTYMLYTNIASARTESGGLGGWNWCSDAYWSLRNCVALQNGATPNCSLSMYTVLEHAFGADKFIQMARTRPTGSFDSWYNAVTEVSGMDMTFYLRDVCGFELSESVLDAAAEKNLPMFVPSACVYQSGYVYENETVEMGKPFYIPLGRDKAIDFSQTIVVPNGVTFAVESVSMPEHGTIEKTGEMTYVYKPGSYTGVDSFTVKVKLTVEATGYSTFATYLCKFAQDAAGSDVTVYDSKGYTSVQAAIDGGVMHAAPLLETSTTYAGCSIASTYAKSLTKVQGKIVFPSKKTYKLFVKGDDQADLYVGSSPNNLEKKAWFTHDFSSYTRENGNNGEMKSFEFTVGDDRTMYYTAYVLNTGGAGGFRIGVEDSSQVEGGSPIEGENGAVGDDAVQLAEIIDVPGAYVYKTNADSNAVKRSDFKSEKLYSYTVVPENPQILESQEGITVVKAPAAYAGSNPNLIVDGNSGTFFHSAVDGVFPKEFIFDLGRERQFNAVKVGFRRDTARGRIENYRLYVGNDLAAITDEEAQPFKQGILPNAVESTIVFTKQSARYVRLIADSAYIGNGQYYVAMSDFFVGNALDANASQIALQSDSNIIYKGNWSSDAYGVSLQGLTVSSKGSAEVNFHGTDIALYCKKGRAYGSFQVRLDGGDWQTIDLHADRDAYRQVVYVAPNLSDGYHKLEIKTRKNNVMNIDYFAITPTTPPPDTGLGLWWILIGFAIAVGAAGIGIAAYFVTRWVVRYRNAHPKTEKPEKPKKEKLPKEKKQKPSDTKPSTANTKQALTVENASKTTADRPAPAIKPTATKPTAAARPSTVRPATTSKPASKPSSASTRSATTNKPAAKPTAKPAAPKKDGKK